jgi:hypothetical protein
MAGLPEAANILLRESCRLPRTGKGDYTLKDDQFCAILLCTTVTDHNTYSACIADNNVYEHERKGKRGAQVGGHIHWVIRKVRLAHIRPNPRVVERDAGCVMNAHRVHHLLCVSGAEDV